MIVDRIFDAAPRPFTQANDNKDHLSYEDFIFFMLSEEDKANEISVRYWFACVDVDGDGMLNNMEMRSFYAVQLHRMQCMGHEIVPFEGKPIQSSTFRQVPLRYWITNQGILLLLLLPRHAVPND